ncbi:MAG: hypothetical protein PUC65_16620 [Clostridiales bacterium]|nr:hypothetical protein [Clostridiales bacterium]
MNYKKYMKKTALVSAVALSFAVTGCGKKDSNESNQVDSSTNQKVAVSQSIQENADTAEQPVTTKEEETPINSEQTNDNVSVEQPVTTKGEEIPIDSEQTRDGVSAEQLVSEKDEQKKDSSEKNTYSMIAKFDDGEVVLDQNGLSVKDHYGQAVFYDGKINITDKDGNVLINNDGVWIKDEKTGKDTLKINKDGIYVEGDGTVVSWDKDGFKLNSKKGNVSFNFAFPDCNNDKDTTKTKTLDAIDDYKDFDWEEIFDNLSSFLSKTMSDVIGHCVDFNKNEDWKTWDKVTILNCEESINGKIVHTKIWFDDGQLKTMNIPKENMKVQGFTLFETNEKDNNVIRVYH